MLNQLLEYARAEGMASEPGFVSKVVHYCLDVDADGKSASLQQLGDGKGRRYERCPNLSQPEMISGGVKRSQFLIESASVVLLLNKTEEDEAKALPRREFFLSLLNQAADQDERLNALRLCAQLLENSVELERLKLQARADKVKPTDQIVLWHDSEDILQEGHWVDWWRTFRSNLSAGSTKKTSDDKMLDLLTGELATPARTHFKITGLAGIGGLGTGDSLVSFDKSAFQSFGLDQSLNAAMSEASARLYADVLNQLLARSQKFARVKICHWFSRKVEEDPFDFVLDPRAEEINFAAMIERLRSLSSDKEKSSTLFYCLSLSGSSGRVMVRDWEEGNLKALCQNVARWYEDLQIVSSRDGELARSPKLFAVLASLYRDADDIVDNLALHLFRAATRGQQIPLTAISQAVSRFKIDLVKDQTMNTARMGLVKAYFLRKTGGVPVQSTVSIDHPDPAYHCGRLLAILARVQTKALGDVGAGVVQRFYGASSQAPALTFGRLLAGSQHHLNKIEPAKLRNWYEGRIAEVVAAIGPQLPRSLSLEKQALFALGYYQQIAQLNQKSQTETTEV